MSNRQMHQLSPKDLPGGGPTGDADFFSRWVQHELSRLHDKVLTEPLPAELLRLLKQSP